MVNIINVSYEENLLFFTYRGKNRHQNKEDIDYSVKIKEGHVIIILVTLRHHFVLLEIPWYERHIKILTLFGGLKS